MKRFWLLFAVITMLLLSPLLIACTGSALSVSPADLPPPEAAAAPADIPPDIPPRPAAPAPASKEESEPDDEAVPTAGPSMDADTVHPLVGVISGHGGPESGAVHRDARGRLDLVERELNLAVARRLAELLRSSGLGVILDREGDVAVAAPGDDRNDDGAVDDADEIQTRLDNLNAASADLLVSIHFNGFGSSSVRGTATYYCSDRPFASQNKRLAELVHQVMIARLRAAGADVLDRGVQDDSVLGKPYGHLMTLGPQTPRISRPGKMPGVLVEPLFLTNEYEATLLKDPAILEAIAQGLAEGIQAYLAPPPTPTPAATPVPRRAAPASGAGTAAEIVRGPAVPQVGFTFDLGSGASHTPAILDTLARNGIKATFFFTGKWTAANPDIARRIIEQGHEPGNHSYSHPDFTTISDQQIVEELARTEDILRKTTGTGARPWFRPPFGARDARVLGVLANQGYRSIFWTFDSGDWRPELPATTVRDRVINQSTPGAIIVMHGDSPQTAQMLEAEIAGLRSRGLEPVSLSQLLRN